MPRIASQVVGLRANCSTHGVQPQKNSCPRSPSAPLLRSLHWLPIGHTITHKVATLTFKSLHYHQPTYLYQLLNIYSPTRQLRSSGAGLLVKPETSNKTSDRAFAIAAATTWNRLRPKVRTATSTSPNFVTWLLLSSLI